MAATPQTTFDFTLGDIDPRISFVRATNSPSTGDAGLSYGYGIIHARNYSSIVRDIIAGHGWHATDVSRGQMHIVYDNVVSSRNGYGCSTHEGCWHATWRNCSFRGKHGILAGRCAFPTIENCKFIDTRTHGISYGQLNVEVVIRGNTFDIQNAAYVTTSAVYRDAAAGEPGAGSKSVGYGRLFVMEGNSFYGHHLIQAGFATATNKAGSLIVRNNFLRKSQFSDVRSLTTTIIEGNVFDVVSDQFGIVIRQVDTDTSLAIKGNIETGGFTTAGPSFIYLDGTGSPNRSLIKSNETTETLLRMNYAVTLDEVSNNSARGRILLGSNTQTVKNKINNLQGVVDYQTTVTTSANNTVMTL